MYYSGIRNLGLTLFAVRSKERAPRSPVTSIPFALPEHFLSHLPLEDNTTWYHGTTLKRKEQVHVLDPSFNLTSPMLMSIGSMSFLRASLSSNCAPVAALSKSPRRKKGTHRQSAVGRTWTRSDSCWRPEGQTALLPRGHEDPTMEHTCRNLAGPSKQPCPSSQQSPICSYAFRR